MAELSNFIYCISAERVLAPDGKGDAINAMGVLSTITPEFVPGSFSFSIIFSILDLDVTKSNKIQIIFLADSGADLINSGEISLPPIPQNEEVKLPKEYVGLNMSMDFRNVIFESEGLYNTKILLNGKEIGNKQIYVKGRR